MKKSREKKTVRMQLVISQKEADLIKERMAELGITNLSAYLRKMAVDGYIIHLDTEDIQEMVRLLRICSNNLNQYARRANETGSIYAADVEDLRERLDGLWDQMDRLLRGICKHFINWMTPRCFPENTTVKIFIEEKFWEEVRLCGCYLRFWHFRL